MRILISHVYSLHNKGDAALLSILIADIQRVFGDIPDLTVLVMDSVKEGEEFEGARLEKSFMHYASGRHGSSLSRSAVAMFIVVSTLLWASVYRYTKKSIPLPKHLHRLVHLYRDADLIIPVGGGYIRGNSGFVGTGLLFFTIYPLILASIIHKPTVAYTQSVGPFGNGFQKMIAKFALKRIEGIVVREGISLALLREWGICERVMFSVDGAFSFKSKNAMSLREELGLSKERLLVGVTVRSWLPDEAQMLYEKSIAKVCDFIIKKYSANIVIIPQVTVSNHLDDDRECGRRVYDYVQHKFGIHLLTKEYDHHAIKSMYGELDYLIGTRFHSVIFSITSYVPSIAIAYEYKTRGIMSDLGLEGWIIDIEKVQEIGLERLFDALVAHRVEYVEVLRKKLPTYIQKTKEPMLFVKKCFESASK